MNKYRVLIDLGWHEADSKAEAIEEATSKKWQLHQLAYHAVTSEEIIKPSHWYWDEIEEEWCMRGEINKDPDLWDKEDQTNHAWATRNDNQYWDH